MVLAPCALRRFCRFLSEAVASLRGTPLSDCDQVHECTWSNAMVSRYQKHISGPLLVLYYATQQALLRLPPVPPRAGIHEGAGIPDGHADLGALGAAERLESTQGRQPAAPGLVPCPVQRQ